MFPATVSTARQKGRREGPDRIANWARSLRCRQCGGCIVPHTTVSSSSIATVIIVIAMNTLWEHGVHFAFNTARCYPITRGDVHFSYTDFLFSFSILRRKVPLQTKNEACGKKLTWPRAQWEIKPMVRARNEPGHFVWQWTTAPALGTLRQRLVWRSAWAVNRMLSYFRISRLEWLRSRNIECINNTVLMRIRTL